jgi:hypothetical protein
MERTVTQQTIAEQVAAMNQAAAARPANSVMSVFADEVAAHLRACGPCGADFEGPLAIVQEPASPADLTNLTDLTNL